MNQNPYLKDYPQSEVESLFASGSISPKIDSSANLMVENKTNSIYSSSITIPLMNFPADPLKVETKYSVQFTEL